MVDKNFTIPIIRKIIVVNLITHKLKKVNSCAMSTQNTQIRKYHFPKWYPGAI